MSIVRRSGKIIASYIYEITVDSGGTHNEVSRELRLQLPPVKSFPEGTETGMVSASLDEPRR